MVMISTPYAYLIGWSFLDRWYYGVEIKKTAHPRNLWKSYFTSSKSVAAMRIELGDPDIIQVRRVFVSAADALRWEQEVLRRIGAVQSERWVNRGIFALNEFINDAERTRRIVSSRRGNGRPWHDANTKAKIAAAHTGMVLNLSDAERERRAQHFAHRNINDVDFNRRRLDGRARYFSVPENREKQAQIMRDFAHAPESRARSLETRITPEAREAMRVSSSKNWSNVEAGMRAGHKRFFDDPANRENTKRRFISMHQRRRGWSVIVIGDLRFETINECAFHLGFDRKKVRKMIRLGDLATL